MSGLAGRRGDEGRPSPEPWVRLDRVRGPRVGELTRGGRTNRRTGRALARPVPLRFGVGRRIRGFGSRKASTKISCLGALRRGALPIRTAAEPLRLSQPTEVQRPPARGGGARQVFRGRDLMFASPYAARVQVRPATVVLVHGAWHGAWCFDRVLPLVRDDGVSACAVDLPGAGFDSDLAQVRATLDEIDGEVVLLGHSYGGAVVTDAGRDRRMAARALAVREPAGFGRRPARRARPERAEPGRAVVVLAVIALPLGIFGRGARGAKNRPSSVDRPIPRTSIGVASPLSAVTARPVASGTEDTRFSLELDCAVLAPVEQLRRGSYRGG